MSDEASEPCAHVWRFSHVVQCFLCGVCHALGSIQVVSDDATPPLVAASPVPPVVPDSDEVQPLDRDLGFGPCWCGREWWLPLWKIGRYDIQRCHG